MIDAKDELEEEDSSSASVAAFLNCDVYEKQGVAKLFSEQTTKYQQRLRFEAMRVLEDHLKDIKMTNIADIAELLKYISKKLVGESDETVDFKEAFKLQVQSLLTLTERNDLLALLTHKDGGLNHGVLAYLPDFVKRSTSLLENKSKKRKRRSDAIDLQFISDYMHDYCRYSLIHFGVLHINCF